MIPVVIGIILLTTVVVTSMELHPVNQCPNDKEWSDRAHMVCHNNEYRYHCMLSVSCTLVESCIEPQLGSYKYSETVYGVFFLYLNNETDSPEFYQMEFKYHINQNLNTNSSDYWKYQYFAYCKEHTKDTFVFSRTENQTKISCEENQTKIPCEDSPGNCNVVLALAIIGGVLVVILILVVCVMAFYMLRIKHSNNRNRKMDPSSRPLKKKGQSIEETIN